MGEGAGAGWAPMEVAARGRRGSARLRAGGKDGAGERRAADDGRQVAQGVAPAQAALLVFVDVLIDQVLSKDAHKQFTYG